MLALLSSLRYPIFSPILLVTWGLIIFINVNPHYGWSPWNPWCQRWWWQRRLKLHSWWKPLCTRLWMKILIWSTMHYDLIHYARRTHLWVRIFWCFFEKMPQQGITPKTWRSLPTSNKVTSFGSNVHKRKRAAKAEVLQVCSPHLHTPGWHQVSWPNILVLESLFTSYSCWSPGCRSCTQWGFQRRAQERRKSWNVESWKSTRYYNMIHLSLSFRFWV